MSGDRGGDQSGLVPVGGGNGAGPDVRVFTDALGELPTETGLLQISGGNVLDHEIGAKVVRELVMIEECPGNHVRRPGGYGT